MCFTLAATAGNSARDIKPSQQRVEGDRKFSTKPWNVARLFAEINARAQQTRVQRASCQGRR